MLTKRSRGLNKALAQVRIEPAVETLVRAGVHESGRSMQREVNRALHFYYALSPAVMARLKSRIPKSAL